MPLSLRSLIWVKTCRELKEKQEWELEKLKLEARAENTKQIQLLLMDLRSIMFGTLGFGKDQKAESDQAWYGLPSMEANGIKPPKLIIGMSRSAKKKMEQEEKEKAGK